MKQHSLDVGNSQTFSQSRWQHSGLECPAEDLPKLFIQPTNAQLFEVQLLGFEKLRRCHPPLSLD